MIQEQERRQHRASVRQIKYSNTVYTNQTLLSFSNTIQHSIVELTLLVDTTYSIEESLYTQLLELNSQQYEGFLVFHFIPLLQKSLSNCYDFQCEQYRAILCGFYSSPSPFNQLGYQLCVLSFHEGSLISILKDCAHRNHIFYPSIASCVQSPEPENLVKNMTRYTFETINTMQDPTIELELAANDEFDEEEEISLDINADIQSVQNEEFIHSLLPLTILINHEPVKSDISLSQQVCDVIPGSKPLVCGGIRPVVRSTPNLGIPQIDVYLHMQCQNNLPTLNGLFDWLMAYPEYIEWKASQV